jgi:hypothetical protein
MNETTLRFRRFGLFAAVLSTVSWLGFIAASFSAPEMSSVADPMQNFLALSEGRSNRLLYGWSGLFGAFFSIGYFFVIAYGISAAGPIRWLAFLAAGTGAFMTGFAFISVALANVYAFVPLALSSSDQAQFSKIAIDLIIGGINIAWFIGSFLGYGLGLGWLAFEAGRNNYGPKWLNALGVIAGLTGIIWLQPFVSIPSSFFIPGILLNITLGSIWGVGTCYQLLGNVGVNQWQDK